MAAIPVEHTFIVAVILFSLGLFGVLVRRDLIFLLMSVEIMLNSAALAFVSAGSKWQQPDGQIMFIFILGMAASEVAVGLALILRFHHSFRSLNADEAREMRG